MTVVLTVTREGQSRTLRFQRNVITLGRAAESVLPLDDHALSRTHCQFECLGNALYVRDLNSRNGTWVEGESVKRRRLDPGDVVKVGNTRVCFDGIDAAPTTRGSAWKTLQLWRPKKARRLRDSEDENRRLRQLLALTRQIVEELDPDLVLSRIMDTAVDLASAERGFLLVFRGDDLSVEVARNFWRKDVSDPEFEVSRNIAEAVRDQRRGLIVEDAGEDERFGEFLSVHALKLRSVLCVPLIFRGEVKGVLYLDNRFTRGTFREEDRDLVESFADLAAIALENSGRFAAERLRKKALEEEVARTGDALRNAREELEAREERRRLRYAYETIVADSPAMKGLLRLVDRMIPTTLPVVLQGASGAGKERLARVMHQNGPRSAAPFVVLACAALPATLAEVELFGHGRGAYTGAGEARGGLLEEAEGGTLYLDGLDDLEHEVQALFLRVLESGEYRRVGETQPRRADVRIMAACREPLDRLVAEGRFREDLYWRLKSMTLPVPDLSERPEDVPRILERIIAEDAPQLELTPRARKAMLMRPWPGNLLELRNEVRRLATLGEAVVDVDDLGPVEPGDGLDLKAAVAELEKRLVLKALRVHEGNLTRAAQNLGLSRLGLRNKLDRYGIDRKPPVS